MKFYLSSYKIGNQVDKLIKMTENGNKKLAFINNALDFTTDLERKQKSDANDMNDLSQLGFDVQLVDLKKYFGNQDKLEKDFNQFDVIWVRGGNTFVLVQAMKLSGFDKLLKRYVNEKKDVLYGGYSAGVCILSPTLKGIHLVDDPEQKPYGLQYPTIWEGLNIISYSIAPHYKSDHPESKDIDKVVEYMIKHNIPFKTLRDGEVIIIE